MSKRDDGGPAFPGCKKVASQSGLQDHVVPFSGQTLRDYFAAKAMQALLTSPQYATFDRKPMSSQKDIANAAFSVADTMLEARK